MLRRMISPTATRSYQDAIYHLNSLQSNASTIEAIRKAGPAASQKSLPEMNEFVHRIGYKASDFDRLNVIHVAGTKGKGSTCAFVDAVLRYATLPEQVTKHFQHRPLKVGLYSSPHLLQVRERIRINGKPLEQDAFAKYFFQVWDRLAASKCSEEQSKMPTYFRFMTLMAFHAFIEEEVDCAIVEVGIGGQFDATNVLENPLVCAVTSLGYDHQNILGKTLAEIAWHKAGIFKKGVPALTTFQKPEASKVLVKRSEEIGCSLSEASNGHELSNLGIAGEHQKANAALAVEISKTWCLRLLGLHHDTAKEVVLKNIDTALGRAKWPGRAQVYRDLDKSNICYFLDGAHTPESMLACSNWFESQIEQHNQNERILVFNCTSGRDIQSLFGPLRELDGKFPFTQVIFVPNNPFESCSAGDLENRMIRSDNALALQNNLRDEWVKLSTNKTPDTKVFSSIEKAITSIRESTSPTAVLVTGSLHLIGAWLTALKADVE